MARARLLPLAAGAAAAVALVATNHPGAVPIAVSPFPQAVDACGLGTSSYVDVADADHTLTINGKGEESLGLYVESLSCLLDHLGTTSAVVDRMDHTRALDGMQDADWGDYHASWTYHPDDGLDLTITWGN